MAIFHCYVSSPEGIYRSQFMWTVVNCWFRKDPGCGVPILLNICCSKGHFEFSLPAKQLVTWPSNQTWQLNTQHLYHTLIGGLEYFFFPHHIGNVIIPTDEITPSFFRGVGGSKHQAATGFPMEIPWFPIWYSSNSPFRNTIHLRFIFHSLFHSYSIHIYIYIYIYIYMGKSHCDLTGNHS